MHFVLVLSGIIACALAGDIKSNFYLEEPCANVSGFCLLESECHHSVRGPHRDLCGGQKEKGAVCCTDFPQEDVNCYQLHNACSETCPPHLDRGNKGCELGETCCVLT